MSFFSSQTPPYQVSLKSVELLKREKVTDRQTNGQTFAFIISRRVSTKFKNVFICLCKIYTRLLDWLSRPSSLVQA